MKFICVDEAGTSVSDPITVVAAIVVEADSKYAAVETTFAGGIVFRSRSAPRGLSMSRQCDLERKETSRWVAC